MRPRGGLTLAFLAASLVAACANLPPPSGPFSEAPPSETPRAPAAELLSSLPGWGQDDHLAAFEALLRGCAKSGGPQMERICAEASTLSGPDDQAARTFLEANFRAVAIPGDGLLTAYFSPVYQARRSPEGEFTAPVRPPPIDPPADARAAAPERAQIEAQPCGDALAWMRPEDLFFLQIQGSGVLDFADGTTVRAIYAGSNGAPFRGIALPLTERGLLAEGEASAQAIRTWLASNRGPIAEEIMDLDPRYVYFRLAPDDGPIVGAAGIGLIPGRSVAIDPSDHRMGDLLWIDASDPRLSGARPSYRRLVVALDTGGGIKGPARADLYLGEGSAAGEEAGRVRHLLHLYRLVPAS
ncbi:MAG: MltA domain-containing protein [Caulobacteraceae bacterium]